MTIVELLKSDDYSARITFGYRWLVGSKDGFAIYERMPYQKKTKTIGQDIINEHAAVRLLVNE